MSDEDCYRTALGTGVDPSGAPWSELDPARLREQRTSLKWTRFPADVLPLFVAEMDFAVAAEIRSALIERVELSDTGYLDNPGPLAPAFAEFARDRWGWEVPHAHVHLATDVATGVVEALRVFLAQRDRLGASKRTTGSSPDDPDARPRLVLPTPVYPGFYEMLEELPFEIVEIPLLSSHADADAGTSTGGGTDADADDGAHQLDLAEIRREFASDRGVDAFLLCNPHNPHGVPFSRESLAELARLAAEHDVFVLSDEIHAPLTWAGQTFTPFAPLAAEVGALSATATSASKGWNLAGAKCSVLIAADDRANSLLQGLPPETTTRASILGLHANVAAFRDGRDWLDRTIAQVQANEALFASLVADRLPGITTTRPSAGYLAWLDLRGAGLGDDPQGRILHDARVALNDGAHFGPGGAGHARLNLACAPETLVEAVERIAAILPARPEGTGPAEHAGSAQPAGPAAESTEHAAHGEHAGTEAAR